MFSKPHAGQAVPDTRLPFKDAMAFNRNTQEYIPFRTPTDAMLASLTLAYRLASPVLAVVLALVRHPDFNPADITLSKPEDVWARVAEHTATKRRAEPSSFRFVFPRVILNEVVDIFAEERRTQLHVQRDTDGPQMGRIEYNQTDGDLRNISLVCKDWAGPAQRALGKILALQDARKVHIMEALKSPLFGPWTTEALIFRHNRDLDEQRRKELYGSTHELWKLMAKLLTRMPNVRVMSLCTDWFEMPLQQVADGFSKSSALRELRLVQAGDIAQLLGAVCKKIGQMPLLKHLYLQFSGVGSAYTKYIPLSELQGESPCPTLEKVTLKVGNASSLSLRYIQWLTRPREGENGFRLKSLDLDLAGCYYNEYSFFEALVPCFRTLSELVVNVSGLSEGLLTRILRECRVLTSLKINVRHTFENSMFDELPATLEVLRIDTSQDKPSWELADERLLHFFSGRCPRNLRRLVFHCLCYNELPHMDIFPKARSVAVERNIDFVFCCALVDGTGCTCSDAPLS